MDWTILESFALSTNEAEQTNDPTKIQFLSPTEQTSNLVLAEVKLNGPIGRRVHGHLPLVHTLGLDVGALEVMRGLVATSQEGGLRCENVFFTNPGLSGDDAGEVSPADPVFLPPGGSDLICLAWRQAGDANGG